MKTKLSVVISVFNEESNVEMLISKIHENLLDFEYEILLVDDGSSDRTVPKIKTLRDDKVHLIELQKNYGQSSALAAGIDYATGDYIVTMDGDLQNDPADIPQMVEKALDEDWDLVAGIRKNRKDNWLRKIPSKIANSIIRHTTGVRVADNGCALKVFKAQLAKNIGLYGELHRFISVLAAFEGGRITQMEVNHYPRKYGQSKYGFRRTFKVISDLLLMIFFRKYMQKPMHLFGSLGILAFVAGAVINLYLLALKIGGQDLWGKPLLLLGVMLLIGGIQLVTIGIMAEFLMRTYYESQQKKPYRVRNVTTFQEEK
ncbi:MAG: glycosyltransferase family 2 protein [Bacteroidales bacterium]|nr:glycosyltransferase family 2 protein [Bacteroidales bacterium]MCF8337477.1 glycosyltransferase family 2 protein [Bacteroidales bacterium]